MNIVEAFNKRKNSFLKKENIYSFLLIFIIFFLDRISKIKIINDFKESTFFVNDFINIELIWNTGIGFGILSSDTALVYNLITFLIGLVILILFYFAILSEFFDKFIYTIIIGGAIGNYYDRIIFNAVPDFIDLHYNNFHWFIFNLADIFITIGIIAFLIKGFFVKD
jgi:signal peptidase II